MSTKSILDPSANATKPSASADEHDLVGGLADDRPGSERERPVRAELEGTRARVERDRVDPAARATVDAIGAVAAHVDEQVVARATDQRVVAGAADQRVVARARMRVSLPAPPSSVLLPELPVSVLARVLPVPPMLADPVSVRFSTLAPSV